MPKRAGGGAPSGLDADYSSVWRLALKALTDQETWTPAQRPLLDEYVFALQAAEVARLADEPTHWDRHAKRASVLADQLALSPRGRKAVGCGNDEQPTDPFARFAPRDELAARRGAA